MTPAVIEHAFDPFFTTGADRDAARAALTGIGFACVEVASVGAALTAIATGAGFEALLSDQHLPDGLGSDLVAPFLLRNPGAGVVLASGRPDSVPKGLTRTQCLPKPLDPRRLSAALEKARR